MSLLTLKEQPVVPVTALLCEVTLADNTSRRWASHRCQDGPNNFEARIHPDQVSAWKLTSDVSSESTGQVSVVFADNDGALAQLFQTGKLTGAKVRFWAAVLNGRDVVSKHVLLTGMLDTVNQLDGKSARLNVLSRLSSIRSSFPPMRIQKQCSWAFPSTPSEREAAASSGEDGRYSSLFRCGYSPDVAGGTGTLDGANPFTSCDYTRKSCEQRGMFAKDSSNRVTQRFSGIEFVPVSYLVRGHGESSGRISNLVSLDTRFNDVVPAVYGTGWLQAPVVFSRNDGNFTRCEILLGLGEIKSVIKVVADGYEIPEGVSGQNMNGTGWYNLVSKGNRTGALNLGLTDASGAPAGDPYGSMAYLNLVLPNRINDGKRSPKVEVLMKGMKLPVLDSQGTLASYEFSANPAWIMCDILRRTGWKLDELDLQSFVDAAAYCDQLVEARDANGTLRQVRRFETNLVLKRRYSVGELLRSIRFGSLLFLYFQPDGRLAVRPEATIAQQQPAKPAGSNASAVLNSGWPTYEFGDGLNDTSGILLKSNYEPDFRVYSKPSQDSPNRVSFEIQDALNEFQQDSISIADTDDIRIRRQEISQSLAAIGVPNFPQAQRVCQTWLNKSIAGNVYLEFRTTVKGFHIRPGDLIAISYGRYGFDRTIFRVLEFQLSPRLDEMKVICQLHQDHWYSDSAQVRYDRSRLYAWRSGSARAVCGTLLDQGTIKFDASESLGVDSSGNQRAALTIPFERPATEEGAIGGIPLVSFDYAVQTTGGSLAQGSYFYGLTTVDASGKESGLSSLIPVRVGGLTATNRVTLNGISVGENAQVLNVYRGTSPSRLHRIASGVAIASSIQDIGAVAQPQLPPDSNYSRLRAWYRQSFLVDQTPSAWTEKTITGSALNLVENRWVGKKLLIRSGTGEGQEIEITANTANTITIARSFETMHGGDSKFTIVDTAWTFAAESDTSTITVMLPLIQVSSFEVSLRSVSKDDSELDPLESPWLVWQVGVGSSGNSDTGVPPEPVFGFSLIEEGMISIGGIAFPALENLSSIYVGQLGVLFWDELTAPTATSLGAALLDTGDQVTIDGLASTLPEGTLFQIEEEIFEVNGPPVAGNQYPVIRARYSSSAAAHSAAIPLFVLARREMTIPFAPGYFNTTAGVGFRYNFRLPNVRLSGADLTLWNPVGASPKKEVCYTGVTNFGVRTLSGGQITMNVQGYLAIEASAGNSYQVDRATVVRDVSAYVQEPPVGGDVEVLVRVNGSPYCDLVIEAGFPVATAVSRFNVAPIPAGATISFDILNVPPASAGTPGRDLTVLLQI
ncbi:MAG: hypothetical protein FJW36_01385 [Acidobacteria bacterium]|nr:hypothetical protein [Acidobacteriota bacterium]